MAANMKVNTRRLGEDIAALSDRLAAMQRTAAELAPALDAPRADALTEQLDRLEEQEHEEAGEARRETATVTMVADVTDVHGESVIPGTEREDHPVVEVHQYREEDDLRDH